MYQNKKNYDELYKFVSNYRKLIFKEKNLKNIAEFVNDLETVNELGVQPILLKTEDAIVDENFEYVEDSKIDGQKIYKYKKLLPKFEYITTV